MIKKSLILGFMVATSSLWATTQSVPTAEIMQAESVKGKPASAQVLKASEIKLIRAQEENIAQNRDALQSGQIYKKILRTTIKVAAGLGIIYWAYSHIYPWIVPAAPVQPIAVPEIPADLAKWTNEMTQTVNGLRDAVLPSTFSWEWFKANAASIRNLLLAQSAASMAGAGFVALDKAVLHPDTLEWYVHNKTNLTDLLPYQIDLKSSSMMDLQMYAMMLKNQDRLRKSTLEELRDYVSALEALDSMNEENKAMNIYLIKSTCNSMVGQIESILGFMAMRHDTVSEALGIEIASHVRYLLNCTNAFCDKLDALLADQAIQGQKKKQDLTNALSELKGEIRRVITRFVAIERGNN